MAAETVIVRVLGDDLARVELPDGRIAAGGDVLHVSPTIAAWLTKLGKAELVPAHFDRVRFTRPGFLGFEAGDIVRVAWMPTEPDVATTAEAELDAVAHLWAEFHREGMSQAAFRDVLRKTRYAVYADLDDLPRVEPPSRRGQLRISEALLAVDGGFAEPVSADVDERDERWLAQQGDT